MGLTIKNFNIFGVSLKNPILGGGGPRKPIQRGDCLKRGIGQFAELRKWGLARQKGVVLLRGFGTPIYTMFTVCILITLSCELTNNYKFKVNNGIASLLSWNFSNVIAETTRIDPWRYFIAFKVNLNQFNTEASSLSWVWVLFFCCMHE